MSANISLLESPAEQHSQGIRRLWRVYLMLASEKEIDQVDFSRASLPDHCSRTRARAAENPGRGLDARPAARFHVQRRRSGLLGSAALPKRAGACSVAQARSDHKFGE